MKKTLIFVILISAFFTSLFSSIKISAHSSLLEVGYDECKPQKGVDDDDERWYYLCGLAVLMGQIITIIT